MKNTRRSALQKIVAGSGAVAGLSLAHRIEAAESALSANLKGKRFLGLSRLLPSYKDFDFDGKKVRVFGLTTNEIHYMYPLRPLGFISSSHNAGIKQATLAKKDNVDFTIALTHIGLAKISAWLKNHAPSIWLWVATHISFFHVLSSLRT